MSNLETEYELQDKITAAYQKLTRDTSVSKSIRRSRDECYRKAYSKVSHGWNSDITNVRFHLAQEQALLTVDVTDSC